MDRILSVLSRPNQPIAANRVRWRCIVEALWGYRNLWWWNQTIFCPFLKQSGQNPVRLRQNGQDTVCFLSVSFPAWNGKDSGHKLDRIRSIYGTRRAGSCPFVKPNQTEFCPFMKQDEQKSDKFLSVCETKQNRVMSVFCPTWNGRDFVRFMPVPSTILSVLETKRTRFYLFSVRFVCFLYLTDPNRTKSVFKILFATK